MLIAAVPLVVFVVVKAATIGSNTAPSRIATQQLLNNGDYIAGFVALDGGILLSSMAVTATFDCFFPISGNVNLNGGVLLLNKDLYLENLTSFAATGTINAVGHRVELSTTMLLTGTCFQLNNANLVLNEDLTINPGSCLKFSGNNLVNGRGNILTINSGGSLIVDKNSGVFFENIVIRGVHTGQLLCLDNIGTMSFQNTQLVMDGDYTFTNGRFNVFNQLLLSGPTHSFIYSSTQQSIISSNAVLTLDDSVTFSYQPTTGIRTALLFTDTTSQLYLNNAIFATAAAGINLLKGKMLVDGSSTLFSVGTTSGTGITFGDGASVGNDFIIRLLPAANLFLTNGFFLYNNI